MPGPEGTVVQRGFAGGELTPAEWARTDNARHAQGLKTARNGFIQRQGGFANRPGTAMVAKTKVPGQTVRLLRLIFSNTVAFVLEFGNKYVRVYQAGAQVQTSGVAAWNNSTAYLAGALVTYGAGTYYCVAGNQGQPPTSTAFWYAQSGTVYEFPSPYATADLPNIQYKQIENVLYLACAGQPPQKLTCTGATGWVFEQLEFFPVSPSPLGMNFDYQNLQPSMTSHATGNPYYTVGNQPWPEFAAGGTFLVLGSLAGNVNAYSSVWNFPWSSPNIGDYLAPGVAGYPSNGSFQAEFYAVTAVNTLTGVESFPVKGAFSNFQCTGFHNGSTNQAGLDPTYNPSNPGGSGVGVSAFRGIGEVCVLSQNNVANASVITAISQTNPLVITVASSSIHGVQTFNTGDLFEFAGTGISFLDGTVLQSTAVSGNNVTFAGIDSTNFPAPTLSSSSILTCLTSIITALEHGATQTYDSSIMGALTLGNQWQGATPWNKGPLTLNWAPPSSSASFSYNVYKRTLAGLWGFMGNVASPTFTDTGQTPDTSKGLPNYINNFVGTGGNSAVIGVYQQRLCLANLPGQQDWFFASNTGAFEQFTVSSPTPVASDSVQFQIAGEQYNEITQIVDNGFLLIFTETGEFSCYGSGTSYAAGAITPTQIGLVQQAFYGASRLIPPISVGKNILYVQTLQSVVRELLYNYYINGYSGTDLTIDSQHLFDGYTIVDWAYSQQPNSIVWAVRSDGVLLSLTYLPEIQIKAWTRHDTLGTFESVVAVPEGTEHALYAVVNRFGGTRFVERFASRTLTKVPTKKYITSGPNYGLVKTVMALDPTKFVFMDCSGYHDGRAATINPTITMTPLAGGDYTAQGAGFTLQASGYFFSINNVGQAIILYSPTDGSAYKCVVLQDLSPYQVVCRPQRDLPVVMQGAATSNWALGVNSATGLGYMPDGTEVSVLADGEVVSSPSMETMLTVQAGVVTLPDYYAYIRVGLPYFTDMRALDIDTPQQGQTAADKPQIVERVALYVQQTRGLWAGSRPPSDDDINPLENLTPFQPRTTESLGSPPESHTGVMMVAVKPLWMFGGGVFIRQPDPLPMVVESIMPAGKFMMNEGR